ncbi:hypothetical protein, partial [Faecalibaculum rodentium]
PGEVPVFEKYDEFVPEELVRKGFAHGVLDVAGMKQRVLSWKAVQDADDGRQGQEPVREIGTAA